jgi:CHAD domain-containing protein
MGDREREIKLLAVSREQLLSLGRLPTLGGHALCPLSEAEQEDTYFDTPDYRLFRSGLSLRHRAKAGRYRVTLKEILPPGKRPLLSDRGEWEEDIEDPSAIGSTGAIGERLAPLFAGQRIEPLAILRTRREKHVLGTPEGGTAELCLDSVEVFAPGAETPVGAFFEMEAEDRGIGPEALEVLGQELVAAHGLLPSGLSKFERGLAVRGLLAQARQEDRTYETTVLPTDRLIDAAYRVFRRHFERMRVNEPGTRLGEDIEFLHDMRVSTRRLRAAFRTFAGAFPAPRLAGFNRELKWIAAMLGEVRDLDVYLERFPEYSVSLPEMDRAGLEIFKTNLHSSRVKARTKLLRALDTARFQRFVTRFDQFLERGAPLRPSTASARLRVTTAAPTLFRRELKRVLKKGRSVGETPIPDDLHDLRIRCKRLRYTAEFFGDIYGKPLKKFIKTVVELQDLLGAHQDACMAGDVLRAFAANIRTGRRDALLTALALGQLIAAQDRAAARSRARFHRAWSRFDRKSHRSEIFNEMDRTAEPETTPRPPPPDAG